MKRKFWRRVLRRGGMLLLLYLFGLTSVSSHSSTALEPSRCRVYANPTFRIFAGSGYFPVPNYLTLNLSPVSRGSYAEIWMRRLPDKSWNGADGGIAFGIVTVGKAVPALPNDLEQVSTLLWRREVNLTLVSAYKRDRARSVGGVPVNTVVVLQGAFGRIDFYGDHIEDEVVALLNLFTKEKGTCIE